MVTPLAAGSLQDFVTWRGGWLTNEEIKIIFTELLATLLYVHSMKIVHRDLKTAVSFFGAFFEVYNAYSR
jgi:serine/threonine protein kinase